MKPRVRDLAYRRKHLKILLAMMLKVTVDLINDSMGAEQTVCFRCCYKESTPQRETRMEHRLQSFLFLTRWDGLYEDALTKRSLVLLVMKFFGPLRKQPMTLQRKCE